MTFANVQAGFHANNASFHTDNLLSIVRLKFKLYSYYSLGKS